jgi:hypothetical protein
MATTIPNPHDLIFKQFYGNPQTTAEFLRHIFGDSLSDCGERFKD